MPRITLKAFSHILPSRFVISVAYTVMIQPHRFVKVLRDHDHTGFGMKRNGGRKSWVFPVTMKLEKTYEAQLIFSLKS